MHVRGVCRMSKLRMNMPLPLAIQQDKSASDILARGGEVWSSIMIKIRLQWAFRQLLPEHVSLVERCNDWSFDGPSGVTNRVKQVKGFLHATDCLVFDERLVILREGDYEQQRYGEWSRNSCHL
jgi:hypothetical protein